MSELRTRFGREFGQGTGQCAFEILALHALMSCCINSAGTDAPCPSREIYLGLNSGFRSLSTAQFWGVYEVNSSTGALIVYVPKNTRDLIGTVLYTSLSSREVSRYRRFLAEIRFPGSVSDKPAQVHNRIEQDLELLLPKELLLFPQHMKLSRWDSDYNVLHLILFPCEELLIRLPSFKQLKQLGNIGYLSDTITDAGLVRARVD